MLICKHDGIKFSKKQTFTGNNTQVILLNVLPAKFFVIMMQFTYRYVRFAETLFDNVNRLWFH